MSELGDLIIEVGPFAPDEEMGGFGMALQRSADLNALRDELIELRELRDAGPPPVNRPHPTCIDVTGIDQTPGSAWTCGPECPKEA